MKKILFATVFFSTLIGGIATSNSVDIRGKIDAYVHQDCARWGDDWLASESFTIMNTLVKAMQFHCKNLLIFFLLN